MELLFFSNFSLNVVHLAPPHPELQVLRWRYMPLLGFHQLPVVPDHHGQLDLPVGGKPRGQCHGDGPHCRDDTDDGDFQIPAAAHVGRLQGRSAKAPPVPAL